MSQLLIKRAKNLRKEATNAEYCLWKILKNRFLYRYKFRRQYVVGNYIVDFVCLRRKLIVELDGGQHADAKSQEYDQRRTEFLSSKGYKVLRFWNDVVFTQVEAVVEVILKSFAKSSIDVFPHPNPLPHSKFIHLFFSGAGEGVF